MPIHEYVCEDCGLRFEVLSDRWDGRCMDCGSTEVERKFSTFSFYFRGLFELMQEEDKEEQDASRV